MTFDDLCRSVLEILPNAVLWEDEDGHINISTGLSLDGSGEVVAVPTTSKEQA